MIKGCMFDRTRAMTKDEKEASIVIGGISQITVETKVRVHLIGDIVEGMLLAGHGTADEIIEVAGFLMNHLKGTSDYRITEFVSQFNQVMRNGKLGASEYKGIKDVSRNVIRAIAHRMGYRLTGLKMLVFGGGVSSEQVFAALLSEAKKANNDCQTIHCPVKLTTREEFEEPSPLFGVLEEVNELETDARNSWVNIKPEMTHMLGLSSW